MSQAETDIAMMRLALDEARAAGAADEVPVGAVLVDPGGRVVARGRNASIAASDAVACDGGHGALGHPVVTYPLPESGAVTCWYCSRTFVRKSPPT